MKFNTTMPNKLVSYYSKELENSRIAFLQGDRFNSWQYLERAHILAQPYPIEHTTVHWKMLQFGIKTKNMKEIIGQLPRLFFGGVKSFVGKVPIGNTGGANVPLLQPMEIPDELKEIIEKQQAN